MADWILKTEPSTYSFDQLVTDGKAVWDGVTNPVAVRNIRSMKKGDRVMIYHTGDEKAVVGLAEVTAEPYPDPGDMSGKLAVVELKPGKRLPRPVTLAEIRADAAFQELALVRQPRLSVVPIAEPLFKKLLGMAQG